MIANLDSQPNGPTDAVFTDWSAVPNTLKTKTQWGQVGRALRRNATPRAMFHSTFYHAHYRLYDKRSTREKRRRAAEQDANVVLTLRVVLESLWVINKHVKALRNRDDDYALKDEALELLKPHATESIVHYAEKVGRRYVVARQYHDDEDHESGRPCMSESANAEYRADLLKAQHDDRGRPYLTDGVVYDVFECFRFGNYCFHRPIGFNTRNLPAGAVKIAEGTFMSPRKTAKGVRQARLNLKRFVEGGGVLVAELSTQAVNGTQIAAKAGEVAMAV